MKIPAGRQKRDLWNRLWDRLRKFSFLTIFPLGNWNSRQLIFEHSTSFPDLYRALQTSRELYCVQRSPQFHLLITTTNSRNLRKKYIFGIKWRWILRFRQGVFFSPAILAGGGLPESIKLSIFKHFAIENVNRGNSHLIRNEDGHHQDFTFELNDENSPGSISLLEVYKN